MLILYVVLGTNYALARASLLSFMRLSQYKCPQTCKEKLDMDDGKNEKSHFSSTVFLSS